MSDIRLNQGYSGGPILNLEGKAIGVATYGILRKPGGGEVNSIIPIGKGYDLIQETKSKQLDKAPSASKLPDKSPVSIPHDMIERTTLAINGVELFLKAPKNFRTHIKAPFEANLNAVHYRNLR